MAVNDNIQDRINRRSINLERVSVTLGNDALRELRRLEKDLIAKLSNSGIDEGAGLTKRNRARLSVLLQQTTDSINTSYGNIRDEHRDSLNELANIEARAASTIINNSIGTPILSVETNIQTLQRLVDNTLIEKASSKEWWGRQKEDIRRKFKDTVSSGILEGQTNSEIIRQIRGTRSARFKNGIMEISRRNAETLVRSSIVAVSTQARLDIYKANEDIISSVQWTSTLDSRTSTICQSRSGLLYTVDGKPIGHNKQFLGGPPAHFGCRSTLTPITKSWDELTGKRSVKLKGQRPGDFETIFRTKLESKGFSQSEIDKTVSRAQSSMNGAVPKVLNYEEWLRSKSITFQVSTLGEGRFNLWKEGNLTFRELTDFRGMPLTLAQLNERVA